MAATTLWEFQACVAGWNRAQGDDAVAPPSEDQFKALIYAAAEQDAAELSRG